MLYNNEKHRTFWNILNIANWGCNSFPGFIIKFTVSNCIHNYLTYCPLLALNIAGQLRSTLIQENKPRDIWETKSPVKQAWIMINFWWTRNGMNPKWAAYTKKLCQTYHGNAFATNKLYLLKSLGHIYRNIWSPIPSGPFGSARVQ